jgi:hypothetical protein
MSNKNIVPPEMSLMETITESDLSDIVVDLSESLFDQLLQDGLLRDIPVVGSLVNMAKAGIDVANYLFVQKIIRFLYHLKDIPEEQRQRFLAQLDADEKFKRRVGENLLLLLNRLDDMQKPELLGRVFRAYIVGSIDYATYQKLAVAVDRIRLYNIPYLLDFYEHQPEPEAADDEMLQDLAFCGLVNIPEVKGLVFGRSGYTTNELGKLFIEIAVGKTA